MSNIHDFEKRTITHWREHQSKKQIQRIKHIQRIRDKLKVKKRIHKLNLH